MNFSCVNSKFAFLLPNEFEEICAAKTTSFLASSTRSLSQQKQHESNTTTTLTTTADLLSSSLESNDSFLREDEEETSRFEDDVSDDSDDDDGSSENQEFICRQTDQNENRVEITDGTEGSKKETSMEDALRFLVGMNPSLARFPSCLNYLMEDRLEAHKLSGMKTAQMLTGLTWSLSRPELLSGPLITRNFLNVSDNIISRGNNIINNKKTMSRILLDHGSSSRVDFGSDMMINGKNLHLLQHHINYLHSVQYAKNSSLTSSSPPSSSVTINPPGPPITVMQWNVLSQAIGFHCDRFSTCSPRDISWCSRKWKIIFEIAQYSPDILCLQEVDRFYFIHKMLQKVGFDGKFIPKPDSPCYHLPDNTGPDGCAIFYNTDRFVLLKTSSRILHVNGLESNQVALLCTFKCKVSGRIFAVATTHLKARKGSLLSLVRDEQGKDLLRFVESECHPFKIPFIITGDFNAETTEPVYQTMSENLSSVYQDNLPPRYLSHPSNWTQRESEESETRQTVDYMFYPRDSMTVTSILDLYSPDLKTPLPNDQYPSDHLSLGAKFLLH